jgi:uncharacterized protein YukE
MSDLPPLGELPAMVGLVSDVCATIRGYGDWSRLAGDPAALRDLARSHHHAASALNEALEEGRPGAAALAGTWRGDASGAFAGYWTTVTGHVDDLAGRHTRMARALDDVAGGAEHLNGRVMEVLERAEAWLPAAGAAIVTLDVVAIPGLLGRGQDILGRWRELLEELEAFAAGLPERLDMDLGPDLPTPSPTGDGPPFGIPRAGIAITTPLPELPGILVHVPWPVGPRTVSSQTERPGIPDPEDIPPGSTPEDVIDRLPQHIQDEGQPSRKGGGTRYPDPDRPGDQVIIEPGDPGASDPLHQGPYVKISKDGRVTRIPLEGNPSL